MTAKPWSRQKERGSILLLRLMIWIALNLGWAAGRLLLYPITAYFVLTAPRARAASRDFLSRALGRPAGPAEVARHIHVFAGTILERTYLLAGRLERFQVRVEGLEHLTGILATGSGCVLLGAHFGSFEVLRAIGRQAPVRVRPVMFRRQTGAVSRALEALDPTLAASIIEIGRPEAMLQVREAVQRGEIVGMLADRAPGEQKLVTVPFLGSPAAFPTGPLIVAAGLEAPVLLFYGIRTGPRRYTVQIAPFAERIALSRATRMEDLRGFVARYAAALESRCRAHPFNWFNFYPFWEDSPGASAEPEPQTAPPRGASRAAGAGASGDGGGAGPHPALLAE